MIVDPNAKAIKARDLNDTLVGEAFSYETNDGIALHGRIAFIEIRPTIVKVTLDGVLQAGNSVVLDFQPEVELWFSPTFRD
ncbi:hypothetical protein ABZ883_03005 [Streptomyces sp. NPDC046977]|uniref:hypothetical protein n=1 Tax=Streptomyces sp. NPDC046977 TaxID=3154703 RepID=UPI0033E4835E